MDLLVVIDRMLAPLRRRVRLMVARSVVSLVTDGGGIQLVQVKLLAGEVRDGVERFQNYGFTSVPHPGAEGVMVCVGGDRDHGLVIAMDDRRYRLKGLAEGEVAIYDDQGQACHLKRDKTIHLYGCDNLIADVATQATLNCPAINLGGDRETLQRLVDARILAILAAHTHNNVQPGSGSSGNMNEALDPDACCTDLTRGK